MIIINQSTYLKKKSSVKVFSRTSSLKSRTIRFWKISILLILRMIYNGGYNMMTEPIKIETTTQKKKYRLKNMYLLRFLEITIFSQVSQQYYSCSLFLRFI